MKQGVATFVLVFVVSTGLCGCGSTADSPSGIDPADVMVHGNVWKHTGGGIQVRILHEDEPLPNLDVTVNGHPLAWKPMVGKYLVTETTVPIQSNVVYDLSVLLGNGEISASTELCDDFGCLEPKEDSIHSVHDPVLAKWSSGGTGFHYLLIVRRLYPELIVRTHVSDAIAETTYVVPSTAFQEAGTHSIQVFCFQYGIFYSEEVLYSIESNLNGGATGFFGSWREDHVLISLEEHASGPS